MSVRLYETEDISYQKAEAILRHDATMTSRATPLFIMKYAPPGSGKSTCDEFIFKKYDLTPNDFVHLDSDELFESSRELRLKTAAARGQEKYKQFEKTINFPKDEGLLKELLGEISAIRSDVSERKIKNTSPDIVWDLKEKFKAILQTSIDKNYHIMFDITGAAKFHEYYKRVINCIPDIYKIVIMYPIISPSSQKIRTFSRANADFLLNGDEKMYGRLRSDDSRATCTPHARDFFEKTIIPMMYAGLIHEIIMFNNEMKPSSFDFKASVPLLSVISDPTRHTPLRISDEVPVGINEEGIVQLTTQVADNIPDNRRLADKIFKADKAFNALDHSAVAKAFGREYTANVATSRRTRRNYKKTRKGKMH